MDIKTVFSLLRYLSKQTDVKDLTVALIDLLIANFPGVQVTVYSIRPTRVAETHSRCLVGLDLLQREPAVYLNDDGDMERAYNSRQEIDSRSDSGQHRFLIPVELYDTNISHVVVVKHPYDQETAYESLKGLIRIFSDILRDLHEKSYDPLTRLLNRQAFDQTVIKLAYDLDTSSLSKPYSDNSAIAIFDIDHFKDINDKFGHAIGDETLVLFGQTISAGLRPDDMFFRYGGEEFVLLLSNVSIDEAAIVVERSRKAIEARRFPQVNMVTVSIGFCNLAPEDHPLDALAKADRALYYAKQHGRNRVVSYNRLVADELLPPLDRVSSEADFW